MGFFGGAHEWVEQKGPPLPKICHTYPTMMKLGTVIPYLEKTQKYIIHVTQPLSSIQISIFSRKSIIFVISRIADYRYRLHFNT